MQKTQSLKNKRTKETFCFIKARAVSDACATYGSLLRISRSHAHVDFHSSFRFSLRIFEQKRDRSQSTTISDCRDALLTYSRAKCSRSLQG